MNSIQLDGVYSFLDNIKNIKLNDQIKLLLNPNNKISSDAIGVYTLDNKKIGYVPYNSTQLNINDNYKITKINLNKSNLQILIVPESMKSNIIQLFDYENKLDIIQHNYNDEINTFKRYLIREGHNLKDIKILYYDDNFINILIETIDNNIINKHLFYTITKKYYDENIFIYDDFYYNKLTNKCLFELFKIHRLEFYIIKNYKPIDKIINKYKPHIYNVECINIRENSDKNIIYNIENINYKDLISNDNTTIDSDINIIFDNVKYKGIGYNHKIKSYCYIDIYNDDNIIELKDNFNDINYTYLIVKLIITNKKYYNLFNYNNKIIQKISIINN